MQIKGTKKIFFREVRFIFLDFPLLFFGQQQSPNKGRERGRKSRWAESRVKIHYTSSYCVVHSPQCVQKLTLQDERRVPKKVQNDFFKKIIINDAFFIIILKKQLEEHWLDMLIWWIFFPRLFLHTTKPIWYNNVHNLGSLESLSDMKS